HLAGKIDRLDFEAAVEQRGQHVPGAAPDLQYSPAYARQHFEHEALLRDEGELVLALRDILGRETVEEGLHGRLGRCVGVSSDSHSASVPARRACANRLQDAAGAPPGPWWRRDSA